MPIFQEDWNNMVWKLINNFVFYVGLLVFVVLALYYLWAPRYYFPQTDVFFGKNIYNPYKDVESAEWQKAGLYTFPAWYRDAMERLSGNDRYYEVDEYYYDTVLYLANQAFYQNGSTYSQGLFHDDHIVIGCNKIEWTDYPFIRGIHNKQHRINKIRSHGCLLYIKPSVFFDDYQPDHPRLLRNYNGIMVDENFKQSLYLWDQALSAGVYSTLLANTLPKSSWFLPEKQNRVMYVNRSAGTLKEALKTGNYFVATKYDHESDEERPEMKSFLRSVKSEGDTLTITLTKDALAFNIFGQNGDIKKVVKNSRRATYVMDRRDTYIRMEVLFDDGTHYYLNPLHRYAGNTHDKVPPVEVNFLKTWLLRGGGVFALLIVVWLLLYLKRRLKIEIIEPKE